MTLANMNFTLNSENFDTKYVHIPINKIKISSMLMIIKGVEQIAQIIVYGNLELSALRATL